MPSFLTSSAWKDVLLKQHLHTLFTQALEQLKTDGIVPVEAQPSVHIERARDAKFGDFACNLAMQLAKPAKQKPRDLAALLIERLPASDSIEKVDIAGPGFINIFVAASTQYAVIPQVLAQKDAFGHSHTGQGQKVLLEFVSANPTGPLHVGHGRGAAYGAALGQLMRAAGFDVFCEYYVNDAGRQMSILGMSVWLRYLELCGEELTFPSGAYQGDYIWDIAADVHRANGDAFRHAANLVFADVVADEADGGDKDKHVDALIVKAQTLLGEADFNTVFETGLNTILDDIRRDLSGFAVEYEHWFSERSLTGTGLVDKAVKTLQNNGYVYEDKGALWFRSSDFGDEKDRVLVRDDGRPTYFASDVAYHLNKVERGFDHLINIWGADHHGYIPRVQAAMEAMGTNKEQLTVLLVQFATLYRGKEKLQMSTRSGKFVTLRELREEVGTDAARFFYVMRKSEQHLDFDLELAKSQSNDNPVYYIQYAHARVARVLERLEEQGKTWVHDETHLGLLDTEHEQALLTRLSRYPEMIEAAAKAYEPHQIAYYLRELANEFHSYYNAHKIIIDDDSLRNARLSLSMAVQQVLRNGLALLGVSAPEKM